MITRFLGLLSIPLLWLGLTSPARAVEVKVYAFKAGILKTETQRILKDTRVGTPMEIPIPFFLIRHGREWVAFDTGCNAKAATDPVGYWGEELTKAYTPVIGPDELFKQAIRKVGLQPSDLKAVIISHGHLDHAGALEDFVGTKVPIYFQKEELAAIRRIAASQQRVSAYVPGDFKHLEALNVRELDGPFDVFGDQTVIAIPTPGHAVGHQSLYVKPSRGRPFIYAADALYTLENMEKAIPPAVAEDVPETMQNMNWFKLEALRGVAIVPSHDPGYWAKRAWAPAEFVP
jgi:N-acyl homoserine lactone hydrolase